MFALLLFISSIVLFCLTTMQIKAFGAAPRALTPREFLKQGAGVLVGEIVEVRVLEQGEQFESGNVVVEVVEVLKGTVDATLLTFPYRRQLGPVIVNGHGWDFVAPENGKKLTIYFREKDEEYYVDASGVNSIEEITSVGDPKIEAIKEILRSLRLRH